MSSDVEIQSSDDLINAFTASAKQLSEAILVHADEVVASNGDSDQLVAADEKLAESLRAAAAGYAALTGEAHPMIVDEMYDDSEGCGDDCGCAHASDESDAAEDEDDDNLDGTVITVMQRHDYVVVSTETLIAEGRDCYIKNYPTEGAMDAQEEVVDASTAIAQVGQAKGWSELWRSEALAPVGGVVSVLPQDQPLEGDAEGWADLVLEEFLADGIDPVYVQVDVYDEEDED